MLTLFSPSYSREQGRVWRLVPLIRPSPYQGLPIDLAILGNQSRSPCFAGRFSPGRPSNNCANYVMYEHESFGETSSSVHIWHIESLTNCKRTVALTPERNYTNLYNQRFNPPYLQAFLATLDRSKLSFES